MIDYNPLFHNHFPSIYLVPETVLGAGKQNEPLPGLMHLTVYRESRHWTTKYRLIWQLGLKKQHRVLRKHCWPNTPKFFHLMRTSVLYHRNRTQAPWVAHLAGNPVSVWTLPRSPGAGGYKSCLSPTSLSFLWTPRNLLISSSQAALAPSDFTVTIREALYSSRQHLRYKAS